MSHFMFKHGHGFQRWPLIPSRSQLSNHIQRWDLTVAASTVTTYSFAERFYMIPFTREDVLFPIILLLGIFLFGSHQIFYAPNPGWPALANVNEGDASPPSHTTSDILWCLLQQEDCSQIPTEARSSSCFLLSIWLSLHF